MPTLSVCMIVKNEALHLENALNSIKDLADEIIIVDTGSTDRTKAIAKKFTLNIYDYKWDDDFAAARNESLKYANCDWILVLDADETISKIDVQGIKSLISKTPAEISGFVLTQRNYVILQEHLSLGQIGGFNVKESGQSNQSFFTNKDDTYGESKSFAGWMPTPIVRLFRKEHALFSGVVHEDISSSLKGKIIQTPIQIHHYGKTNEDSWKSKWDLYERLAEKKAATEQDYYADFELGRQYLASQKMEKAQQMFLKSITKNNKFWLSWFNLGSIHLLENKLETAITYLNKAQECNPNAVAIYKNLGVVYAKKEQYQKAIDQFVLALNLNAEQADVFKNMALCYQEMGDEQRAYLAIQRAKELNPQIS
ncbi:glycosyltransferase [Candidatus Woesearchaeota archaeon]|nr:glycosyltransferase [Candidatus Woesearchaeota archaeon]